MKPTLTVSEPSRLIGPLELPLFQAPLKAIVRRRAISRPPEPGLLPLRRWASSARGARARGFHPSPPDASWATGPEWRRQSPYLLDLMAVIQLVRGDPEPLITPPPLPSNMVPSVEAWLGNVFWIDTPFEVELDARRLLEAERVLGISVALDWSSHEAAMIDCVERVRRSEEFAIRLLSILLPECSDSQVAELSQILDARGSRWLLAEHDDGTFRIVPRDSGPIQPILEDLAQAVRLTSTSSVHEPSWDHPTSTLQSPTSSQSRPSRQRASRQ